MVYFKYKINSFLVWDASLLVTVSSRQCLDKTIGKIENGLGHGFVKDRLNCLLIIDPSSLVIFSFLFFSLELHLFDQEENVERRSKKNCAGHHHWGFKEFMVLLYFCANN